MSETIPPIPPAKVSPLPPSSEPMWPKVIISALVLILYALAHWIAWRTNTGLDAMLGSDGTMAAAIVYYWVGSSAGSAQKNNIISRQAPPP